MNPSHLTEAASNGDRLTQLVRKLQAAGSAVMFVSPHLDDAVLSCGALITHLSPTCPVTVLTVFTSADSSPRWGLAARKHLRDLGVTDAAPLFQERRSEDIAVLKEAGASWIHLGFTDALFRRVGETGPGPKATGRSAYPSYRFHVIRGRIGPTESMLASNIARMIQEAAVTGRAVAVFGPLGVGSHVDHLITRNAVAASGTNAAYYSDFPYSETDLPDVKFIGSESLQSYSWASGRAENVSLIAGYRTQFAGLFPHGVPISPETYWIRAMDSASAM